MGIEQLQVESRPVVEPLEAGAGRQFEEVVVACLILGQQYQVIGAPIGSIRDSISRHITLDADDRSQIVATGRLVPVEHSIHDAMVRDRQVLHSELLGTLHVFVDSAQSIE